MLRSGQVNTIREMVVQGKPVRAMRPVSPEDAGLFAAVLRGEHLIHGFTNQQIQQALYPQSPANSPDRRRRSAHVSYRLRLLRRHRLIHKVGAKRLYRLTSEGHRVMSLALKIRGSDSINLLAA